jgi:membrane-associated phospholipid phosphatase
MKNILRENKWFLYPFFAYLCIGFVLLLFLKKGDEIFFLNHLHNPITDVCMKYLTDLGDGLFVALLVVSLLWVRYDYFFAGLLSFAISAAVVQFLKKIVFSDSSRPLKYLGENAGLHLVDGVQVHHNFSFPSGHSTTAFMAFFLLALVIQNKKIGILLFFLALLVSLTRPYLVQHFFVDIYVGAIIGVSITAICWNAIEKSEKIKQNPRWQNSLHTKNTKNK